MGRWIAACCVLALLLVAVCVLALHPRAAPGPGTPAGALQLSGRLGHDALRHGGAVDCVAYSPDGKLLATGGDGRVVLWNAATGQEVAALPPPRRAVTQTLLWLGNDRLVVAGFEGVVLMDASNGRLLHEWASAGGHPICLAAPGGLRGLRVAAVRGEELVVSRLQAAKSTAEKLWSVDLGQSPVVSLAFSGDGSRLFLAGWDRVRGYDSDGESVLWDTATPGSFSVRNPLACSADGSLLAMPGPMSNAILLDATTGSIVRSLDRLGGDAVTAFAFSGDSSILACGSNYGLPSLWPIGEESPPTYLPPIRGYIVCSIAFAPDLQTVAVGDGCGVRLWDWATGLEVGFDEGHQSGVHVLTVSPDGGQLVSGDANGALCVWDLPGGEWQRRIDVQDRGVEALSFSPEGRRVAAGSSTGMLRVWDPSSGRELVHWEDLGSTGVDIACWVADGSRILTTDTNQMPRDGHVLSTSGAFVLDPATGDREAVPGLEHEVYDIASTPRGDLVAVTMAGGLRLYSGETLEELRRIETSETIYRVRLAADGSLMAGWGWGSSGSSEVIFLWDTASGEIAGEVKVGGETRVSDAALSPDGGLLACCHGGALSLWRTSPAEEIASKSVQELPAAQATVTFTPDGRRLITGGADSRILVWDLAHD